MKITAAESADNIIRAFERAASMKPGKILIAGEKTLTYGELLKHAALLTSLFRKGGLSPGDRAVISTVDDIAAVTFFLSLLRSGVTAVIIDPETPAPQAQALISAARPKAVFLDSGICGSWQPDKNLFTVEIKKTGGRDSLFDKLIKKRFLRTIPVTRPCLTRYPQPPHRRISIPGFPHTLSSLPARRHVQGGSR